MPISKDEWERGELYTPRAEQLTDFLENTDQAFTIHELTSEVMPELSEESASHANASSHFRTTLSLLAKMGKVEMRNIDEEVYFRHAPSEKR